MPEYGEKIKTNERNSIVRYRNWLSRKNYPTKRTFSKIQIPKPCLFIIFLIILGYYGYIFIFFVFSTPSPDSNVDDFNFTEDIIYSPPSANDLTVSVIHHHRVYKTCDDFEYGCLQSIQSM